MNYYIADCHFGHDKIIEHCGRPFLNVIEMNEYMIENWNSEVKKNDDVYIIGDIAFGKNTLKKYITRLNGKKHLILGNHDNVILKKVDRNILEKCFVEITQYKEIKDNGRDVILFHYPIMEWNKKRYGAYHIHGHIHNRVDKVQEYSKEIKNMFNVGVDIIGYNPVTLNQLICKKNFEDVGRMYGIELNKLNLLELIALIAKVSSKAFFKQRIISNESDVNLCIKNYIREFIDSIPKDFDIESIVSNLNNDSSEVDIDELNINIPDGYSVYYINSESREYILRNGLTKEASYYCYEKQKDKKYITEVILIHNNKVLEHYVN
ncbi:MAG: hypothetical protein ACRC41_01225 [Sarcina sp.]